MKSRYASTRRALIFWCLFIGVGAVFGSVCMLAAPDGSILGMSGLLPYFQVLPFADVLFTNFIFSGISLLIVNGITNLAAAVLLFLRKRVGILLGGIFGVTLMAWICIQFVIFPPNFMSTTYFIFGLIQAATGYAAGVFYRQEQFEQSAVEHSGSKDGRELVVYFSRMGYTKKIALEHAARRGADVYELQTVDRVSGTLGFWWCGRFAMHGWGMPIKPVEVDLAAYERVTICSPIWAFELAAPVRSFCEQAHGKIKAADYILVHFTRGSYRRIAAQLDELLGVKHDSFRSVRCRMGRYSEQK